LSSPVGGGVTVTLLLHPEPESAMLIDLFCVEGFFGEEKEKTVSFQ
jgi:hypothetical protein